ncbi:MAG: 30S ribosomal protein S6 [Candidatus Gracilibacteria bacterium]|jgi:small subunit ribosomal protein S6
MENSQSSCAYEIMVMLLPDMGEAKTNQILEEIRTEIKEHKGKIQNEEIIGLRDLAYRIKKQDAGFYAVLNITMPKDQIRDIERNLNLHPSIMRHIILKTDKDYEVQSFKIYEEEAAKAKQERMEARHKKEEVRRVPEKTVTKEVKKEQKPIAKAPAKVETPKIEEVEKIKEEKPKKKTEKLNLEDVDKKLKSLIDDPDITL